MINILILFAYFPCFPLHIPVPRTQCNLPEYILFKPPNFLTTNIILDTISMHTAVPRSSTKPYVHAYCCSPFLYIIMYMHIAISHSLNNTICPCKYAAPHFYTTLCACILLFPTPLKNIAVMHIAVSHSFNKHDVHAYRCSPPPFYHT